MVGYPRYSRAERIADGTVHGLSISFAISGLGLMIFWGLGQDAVHLTAAIVYGLAMLTCFVASAFYHFSPTEDLRPVFQRLDHAFIFFKIAGTYTPIVVLIGSGFAYGILGIVWLLASVGMVRKIVYWQTPSRWNPVLYLGLGWLSVALIGPLSQQEDQTVFWLIVTGGLTYSMGVLVHVREAMPFVQAIWHGMVLAASICIFIAIALAF